MSIAIIAASIRLYIHRTRKEMERKHKEEILLLRIRNLIEQCNRYEQKKSPEGQNITCVHSHTEPPQTENKQDASESVFLTKAIELVEKNGGRHQTIRVENSDVVAAKVINELKIK